MANLLHLSIISIIIEENDGEFKLKKRRIFPRRYQHPLFVEHSKRVSLKILLRKRFKLHFALLLFFIGRL